MDERRIAALLARLPSLTAQEVRTALVRAGDLAGAAEQLHAARSRAVGETVLDGDLRWLEAGGTTLAVCAHGLDLLYPRRHRLLAQRICARGALVSSLPPGTPPARWRFPARGRLLSGLARATLVVEAARDSGALHTAGAALGQLRPVYAVPGSIRSPVSAGCHALLRRGARLAESAADVLRGIDIFTINQELTEARRGGLRAGAAEAPLDKASEILLDALGFEPVSLNTLVERTGLPSSGIASLLLALELAGRVAPQPGGRYSRRS